MFKINDINLFYLITGGKSWYLL